MDETVSKVISIWGMESSNIVQRHSAVWEIDGKYILKMYEQKEWLEKTFRY